MDDVEANQHCSSILVFFLLYMSVDLGHDKIFDLVMVTSRKKEKSGSFLALFFTPLSFIWLFLLFILLTGLHYFA